MFKRKNKKTQKMTPANAASPSAPRANTNNIVDSISQLKISQSKLEKRVDFLRKKANRHLQMAQKSNKEGNKDDALLNLKRKKVFEKEIKTLESSILTIEEQVLRIEGGSAVADVYNALQIAKNAMKAVTKGVDADKLQELMADMEDLNADQDEIQDILGGQVQDSLNDPDLLQELEELDNDQYEEKMFADLKELDPAKEKDEDEELLRQLRKSSDDLAELEKLVAPTDAPIPKKKIVRTEEDEELAMLEAQMI